MTLHFVDFRRILLAQETGRPNKTTSHIFSCISRSFQCLFTNKVKRFANSSNSEDGGPMSHEPSCWYFSPLPKLRIEIFFSNETVFWVSFCFRCIKSFFKTIFVCSIGTYFIWKIHFALKLKRLKRIFLGCKNLQSGGLENCLAPHNTEHQCLLLF